VWKAGQISQLRTRWHLAYGVVAVVVVAALTLGEPARGAPTQAPTQAPELGMFDGAQASAPSTERPELVVGAAFAGGLLAALILRRLGSHD